MESTIVIDSGRWLMFGAGALYNLSGVLCFAARRAPTPNKAATIAQISFLLASGLVVGATICLAALFLGDDFRVQLVWEYSKSSLSIPFKLGALAIGPAGGLLFVTALIGLLGSTSLRERRSDKSLRTSDEPSPSAPRPTLDRLLVLSVIQLFFVVLLGAVASPFARLEHSVDDGSGVPPLLESGWFLFHILSVHGARALYALTFACAIGALVSGTGTGWVQRARHWALLATLLQTAGIVSGALWGSEILGWGGLWAWDPGQTGALLPWLTGLAFLHASTATERRDVLILWSALLAALPFTLGLLGSSVLWTGLVRSLYSLSSPLGAPFGGSLLAIGCLTSFLLARRSRDFRASQRIERRFSREAALAVSSVLLVSLAVVLLVLMLWPWLTDLARGDTLFIGPRVFVAASAPFACALLFLAAITPALDWGGTAQLGRKLLLPALLAVPLAAVLQGGALLVRGAGAETIPLGTHLYPTALVTCLGSAHRR